MAIPINTFFNYSSEGRIYTGGTLLNPYNNFLPYNPYIPPNPVPGTNTPAANTTDQEAQRVIDALDTYPVTSVDVELRAIAINNNMDTEAQGRALSTISEFQSVTAYDIRIIHVTCYDWLRTGRFSLDDLKRFLSFVLLYKNAFSARAQVVYIKAGGTGSQNDPQINPAPVPGSNIPKPAPIQTPPVVDDKTNFLPWMLAAALILYFYTR